MRDTAKVVPVAVIGLALLMTGCQPVFNLSLNPLEKPVRVVHITDQPLEAVQFISPYADLLDVLRAELDEPVRIEIVLPFAAGPQLANGWYQVGLVKPAVYAQLPERDQLVVLAAPAADADHRVRPALLVTATDSDIETVEDLRGKRVLFGAPDDSRTYYAAVKLLRDHGLKTTDLDSGLPLIGSLWQHEANPRLRVKQVLTGQVVAAFVDEHEWNDFPETHPDDREPAQQKLTIVARTVALPDLLVLGSPKLEPERLDRLRAILWGIEQRHPDALASLGYRGMWPVAEETIANCRALADTAEALPESEEPASAP